MMERTGGLARLDVGVLNPEQQEKLRQFKIKTRIDNEKYLRSHPEVELLISDFLRDVFLKRPANIQEFVAVNRQRALFTMAPKGGTLFFLLLVTCAVLGKHPYMRPGKQDFKEVAKKMMMKCKNMGYQVPERMMLNNVFNNSDLPVDDRNPDSVNTILSTFLDVLDSANPDQNKGPRTGRFPMVDSDQMKNRMWNCTYLAHMIRLMRNSSEASACYVKAFLAPVSWTSLITQSDTNMDLDDYDTLLWAAKPALQDMPPFRINLPSKTGAQKMKKMMKMLQEVFNPMSDAQRTQVVKWAKEQITRNNFNCTMMPSRLKRCSPSLKWLDKEAMTMMGPYLSRLAPHEVDSSPKEKLCEFFRSDMFRSTFQKATRMKPLLAKKFLERVQECFTGNEFEKHVDKLGPLACFYYDAPDMDAELSKKLLAQLNDCDNPRITQLKKRLAKFMISKSTDIQTLQDLGSSVTLLPPAQLSSLSRSDLKKVLKNLGPNVQWTRGQLRALLKKQLGDEKCKEVSGEELKELQSVAEGLPRCMLKQVKSRAILDDREALRNISRKMRKGQLKAMLQGLRGDVDPSELVQKLSGPLLRSISLNSLEKANITSLDQVENKTWSRPQAAYLAKKMQAMKQLKFRKLHSVLQGITCKMIDKVSDNDTKDMAEAVAETPQWLSKVQAGCAARKLFATLEKERADYFKTITQKELNKIPTVLLIHLPPSKVKDLPDVVCPVLIDKMEEANLTSLPRRAPSRPALTMKALQCLTNGANVSTLSFDDVSRLGQFLCELSPSQLGLMAPDVINETLQEIAPCQHIPRRHMVDLIQLVKETFGDPSDWSAETMEALGPILFLNDTITSALPNKPWMKDVLYFLKSRLSQISDALRKKLFELTTSTTSASARRRRQANGNSDKTPTVETIEQLGMDNVFWTAADLEKITNSTFTDTVEILGDIHNYKADQLAVLKKKATEAFGPVSEITESEVRQMQCITQGFPDSDLQRLPFSLDTVEDLGKCGWNDSQIQSVWRGVAKFNNLTPQQLGSTEMVTLNRFICGLSTNEIEQLNKEAFKDAVGSLDGLQCSLSVMQELKNVAVSAFGDPSTWAAAQVSDLGNIIAGLDAAEYASLDSSVFSFISSSSIPLIPPNNFAALSVAQLEALGPDNAAMVTSEQQAALSEEQQAAFQKALDGTPPSTPAKTIVAQSGAPSLSVEGISAFVKPLLFLLMGFLLL